MGERFPSISYLYCVLPVSLFLGMAFSHDSFHANNQYSKGFPDGMKKKSYEEGTLFSFSTYLYSLRV